MLKKLTLSTIVLSALLLNGCGSSGGSKTKTTKDLIQEKEFILITHNYPDEVCVSQELKTELTNIGAGNIITDITDNTVNCNYYERTDGTCAEQVYGGYPNACVVAYDDVRNKKSQKNSTKTAADVMLEVL